MMGDSLESGLRLGTLAYYGSPTERSVIVYSGVHRSWGRVPIPEIAPPRQRDEWLRFFNHYPAARWMLAGLLMAMLCVSLGLYGLIRG
jgi:hypothetical protein